MHVVVVPVIVVIVPRRARARGVVLVRVVRVVVMVVRPCGTVLVLVLVRVIVRVCHAPPGTSENRSEALLATRGRRRRKSVEGRPPFIQPAKRTERPAPQAA